MLDLPEEAVNRTTGDDLASFWQRKPGVPNPSRTERGHVPDGIVCEAYSWGNLARTTVGGTTGIGKAVQAVTRILWTMLLPFALTNVAYWSRRLHLGGPGTTPATPATATDGSPSAPFTPLTEGRAGGAGVFRLAGLVLTLITA